MKKNKLLIGALALMIMAACSPQQTGYNYPETRKTDTVDLYFGTKVSDPYRWLEDDNSAETKEWVKAQNEVTFGYLEQIPFRETIKERLTEIYNYPKQSTPIEAGGYYFFSKNDGLQNQSVYYIQEDINSEPRVILDPNTLSEEGTVAVSSIGISRDGKYCAYGLSEGGSDWVEIFVKNIETGEEMDDHIQWVKFSGISWYKNGFFYGRYKEPEEGEQLTNVNEYQMLYYHKIGTPQSEDKLIYQHKTNPKAMYNAAVTDDEKYMFLFERDWTSKGNDLYIKDMEEDGNFIKLTNSREYDFFPVDYEKNTLYVKTNKDAPRNKLVAFDLNNLRAEEFTDVIPEKESVLNSATVAGGKLFVRYTADVKSVTEVYDYNGNFLYNLELPGMGQMGSLNGEKDKNTAFYSFTSYTYPTTIYKYNVEENTSEVFFEPDVDFESENYTTKQIFYKSKDGTKIPMYIVHKKDLKLDGTAPTLLYGYGGFNVSLLPAFSISRALWLEMGGVFVNANLRGGGEYGEDWHQAGTKLNKQNVFDDFIAAAEYLIDNKYTSPEKLAVQGGSNGGLLVGTVINQRPDLFKVALPAVGVMDMLRFHKFTIGGAWVSDYGSSEDSVQFEYIYRYSPLHNITSDIDYPAVLVTTADHDDRVVPAHSFKYMATLQENYQGKNPVMIRVETDAGHGAGKPVSKQLEEAADVWAFTLYNMEESPDL